MAQRKSPKPVSKSVQRPSSAPVATAHTPKQQNADRQEINLAATSRYWLMAGATVAVLIAFAFGFGNGFVDWDDMEYVVENPLFLYPDSYSVADLWKTIIALNYHPLTMMSLALNYKLFGPGATSFIVTNVFIHLINTVLVFLLAEKLLAIRNIQAPLTPFFTALIWGLHPMHVESVIWVSERKDVLYTLLFLLSCLTYLRFGQTRNRSLLWFTLGLFVLACLAKAMAVVLPLVLLLLDYWVDRRDQNPLSVKALLEKAPFFLIALLFGWMAVKVQSGGDFYGWLQVLEKKNAVSALPFSWRWFVYGSYGFMMYIVKLLAPIGLSAFYPYPDKVAAVSIPGQYWLGPLVFLISLGILIWSFLTNRRLLAFSLSFFLITIVLVLQFMTVGTAMMADRYSYLPYVGLIFGLMAGLELLSRSNAMIFKLGASVFAAICFYLTTQQVKVWESTETLWTHALKYYPDNDQIHEGLGDYYGKRNEIDKAIEHFSAALQDGTERFHVYEGLGNAYGLKGDLTQAISMFDQAIRMDSSRSDLFYNRGITIMRARPDEAVRNFDKALQLAPQNDTLIRPNRAYALLQARRYPEAITDYSVVLQNRPNDATAWHNRGVCRFNTGDQPGALTDIRRALALKPDYPEAQSNLKALQGAL